MKKFLQIVCCMLLITPPLVSCSDDDPETDPTKLDTPALVKNEVGQTSFSVKWSAVKHAEGYVYTLDGGAEKSTTQTEIRFDQVTPDTDYTVKVKAVSTDRLYTDSDWATIEVTTESDNRQLAAPDKLVFSNVTAESFDVSWGAVQNAASYVYQLDDGEEKTVVNPSVTVSGLASDTEYTFRVKATGDAGSDWIDSQWTTQSIRTKVIVPPPFTLAVKDVYSNKFTLTVTPTDPEMPYFALWADETEWANYLGTDGLLDSDLLQGKMQSDMSFLALLTGNTYPEGILAKMTDTGTQDFPFTASVKPNTHYYAFVFGWGLDGSFLTEVVYTELTTPSPTDSDATVTITYGEITDNSMHIICTPDANVPIYNQWFGKSAILDNLFETKEELMQYIITEGYECEGVDDEVWTDLEPETEYIMCIVGFDDQGGWFYVDSRNTTAALTNPNPVVSPFLTESPAASLDRQPAGKILRDNRFSAVRKHTPAAELPVGLRKMYRR